MPNIFGKIWRSFLGVPEVAAPPDFDAILPIAAQATEEAIAESGIREMIDSLEHVDFTYGGEWIMTPWSSNVWGFKLDQESHQLTVGYVGWRGGRDESKLRFYQYQSVSDDEALLLAKAMAVRGSAGGWVWDQLRIRGTKEYIFLPGLSLYHPKRPC